MSILRVILVTPLSLLWQLLNQFLLSPWGLIVPLALLIALIALLQIQKGPTQLALYYTDQLETCTEAELPQLLEVLLRMEDAGVPGLVKGLSSNRELVFTACKNVLQHEFARWQESEQREHHFLVLSEALLQHCEQFSLIAQTEAMKFVDQIMRIRPLNESTADRHKTIACCEQLLSQFESARRKRIESQESTADTVATLGLRTQQPVLLASNGQPFVPTSAHNINGEAPDSFNTFSAARADRLAAYQRQNQRAPSVAERNQRAPSVAERNQRAPSVAERNLGISPSIASVTAAIEEKFAQNFPGNDSEPPVLNISEEYRNQKLSESGGTFQSENFLTPELQRTPLDQIPHLPTTQLMQLLHHPEPTYIETARQTLASRDGFQEPHLKLAWRLYHPIPAVRQEIVAMLPNTPNIQASVWLTVLLSDPNNDVRYRTASFLATTSDPALRRLLVDRGKRDSDARIVSLADRLDESQRGIVRR